MLRLGGSDIAAAVMAVTCPGAASGDRRGAAERAEEDPDG
jgi:hypothetical protein